MHIYDNQKEKPFLVHAFFSYLDKTLFTMFSI